MDVTTETFERDVIERSREVPVVVDFWAAWCGPCRMLGPAIESEVGKRAGRLELAKLDIQAEPQIAATSKSRVSPPPSPSSATAVPSPASSALSRPASSAASSTRRCSPNQRAKGTGHERARPPPRVPLPRRNHLGRGAADDRQRRGQAAPADRHPPEFKGTDPDLWSPEDAFVAAAGSCLAVTIAASNT